MSIEPDVLRQAARAMCRVLYGDDFDLHDEGAQDPESRDELERAAEAVIESLAKTHALVPRMKGFKDEDDSGLLWPGISGHPGLYVSTYDPDGLVYDDESSYLPSEALDIAGQWAAASAAATETAKEQP